MTGAEFERVIASDCRVYAMKRTAYIEKMPLPTVPAYSAGRGAPLYRLSGKAPYDFWGYMGRTGIAVGVEAKASSKPSNTLPIVGPGMEGDGVEYHQLLALVNLHKNGGVARLVWNNGGVVGVMLGDKLTVALVMFDASAKGARDGTRSLRWDAFIEISEEGGWLQPVSEQERKNKSGDAN